MTNWEPLAPEPNNLPIPAGWYPDQRGVTRFWDGATWTEHVSPSTPGHSVGLRLRIPGALAQLALAATLLAQIVLIKAIWDRLSLIQRVIAHPQTVSLSDAQGADNRVHSSAVIVVVTYVIAAIVFITWFYRARLSVERYNPDILRFGRGWAIGSWITPILGFWRPYQMTTDVLCAAELPSGARDWDRRSVGLLRVWWFFFIASAISIRFSSTGSTTSLNDFSTQSRIAIGSASLDVIAAILAIVVVGRITGVNDRRRLADTGTPRAA